MIKLNLAGALIQDHEWEGIRGQVELCHEAMHTGRILGAEFLGWLDYPINYNKKELQQVINLAQEIREKADVLLVIGIGGSYLGTRAVYEALMPYYANELPKHARGGPALYFVGNDISGNHLKDLLDLLEGREVYVNVVSKSGTTLEPAMAFRIVRDWMLKKYGEGAWERMVATTDAEKGVLKNLAERKGMKTFVVPEDMGGRYSVLSPVGTLPLAVSGIDVTALMEGAAKMHEATRSSTLEENPAYQYAAARILLMRKGKDIEILVNYEAKMRYFAEWWKQLYGESEGKDGKGLFPASVIFSADLHSMGQWIQDGPRTVFETVVKPEIGRDPFMLPRDQGAEDGLDFLDGMSVEQVNDFAIQGTMEAHKDGGVPQLVVETPAMGAEVLGGLIYFFEKACAMSGLLNGVNPFDQPGVEAYKKNLYRLLGK